MQNAIEILKEKVKAAYGAELAWEAKAEEHRQEAAEPLNKASECQSRANHHRKQAEELEAAIALLEKESN